MIPRENLPAIFKIVSDTELQLTALLGYKAKLKIENMGQIVSKKEMDKYLIQKLVCDEFGFSWKDIRSFNRRRDIVEARRSYCWLATTILGETLVQVGKDIDRDHTSVIHLRDSCRDLMTIDFALRDHVEDIKTKFYENIN